MLFLKQFSVALSGFNYVLHGFGSEEVGEFFCIMYLDDNLVGPLS